MIQTKPVSKIQIMNAILATKKSQMSLSEETVITATSVGQLINNYSGRDALKMPQGRIVLKAICQSKKLPNLKTDGARLLYTWLIPNVDVNGCFSGDPEVIKGQIFTRLRKSAKTIQAYLNDLNDTGLILLYEARGDACLCIPDFVEKQPYLNPEREAKTTILPPTQEQLKSYSRATPLKIKANGNGKGNGKNKGLFEEARKIYLGTKRGLQTEFDNFIQKHEDWQKVLSLLKPAVERQIAVRKRKKAANEFVPSWKNFKTWINNRCWEEESTTAPADIKSTPPPQAAVCIVDHKPTRDYRKNGQGKPIWLCLDCCRAIGNVDWGKMSKPEIEKAVEQGKRRPPPVKKDPELAKRDRVQAQVQKLADSTKG